MKTTHTKKTHKPKDIDADTEKSEDWEAGERTDGRQAEEDIHNREAKYNNEDNENTKEKYDDTRTEKAKESEKENAQKRESEESTDR